MRLGVIGIGYVGLPVVCLAARKGLQPIAVDIDDQKIDLLKEGKSPIRDAVLDLEVKKTYHEITATTQYDELKNADVIIIAVPTPIDQSEKPDLSILKSVSLSLSAVLSAGQTVIVESTIAPGTCEEVVAPLLEHSGLKLCTDFHIAHCPERIDPGQSTWSTGWNLENTPRVLGACCSSGIEHAKAMYSHLLSGTMTVLSSLKAAECCKVVENSFRDVNIAFVNELARSCDAMGIDVMEVIRGASTKPYAFMAHYPSSGVGGHCIGVDPYYLIEKARGNGFIHRFLSLAREINNEMPKYTVDRLTDALNAVHQSIAGTRITVLGVTFKGNVDDCRESPALKIIDILKRKGAHVEIYDPYVPRLSTVKTLEQALHTEVIVIGANHNEFMRITPEEYKRSGVKIIVDGKNCLDKDALVALGLIYKGIGC